MGIIAISLDEAEVYPDTIGQDVGLCFFDPVTETLLELDKVDPNHMAIDTLAKCIKKYLLAIAPGSSVNYARVRPVPVDEVKDFYTVKCIIGRDEPPVSAFDALPNFNSFRVDSLMAGDFMPVWIFIESRVPSNKVFTLALEVDYE